MRLGTRTTILVALALLSQMAIVVTVGWKASNLARDGVYVPEGLWMLVALCVFGIVLTGILVALLGDG